MTRLAAVAVMVAALAFGFTHPGQTSWALGPLGLLAALFIALALVARVVRHVPDDEDGALIAPRTGPGRWPSDLTQKGLPR